MKISQYIAFLPTYYLMPVSEELDKGTVCLWTHSTWLTAGVLTPILRQSLWTVCV